MMTYLFSIEEIKVHNPACRSKEQWQCLAKRAQVTIDGSPTRKDGRADDGTKNDLRERNDPLHEGIDSAERPHRGEGPHTGLSEGQVCDAVHHRNPRQQRNICFADGQHAGRQGANFAALNLLVEFDVADVAKKSC